MISAGPRSLRLPPLTVDAHAAKPQGCSGQEEKTLRGLSCSALARLGPGWLSLARPGPAWSTPTGHLFKDCLTQPNITGLSRPAGTWGARTSDWPMATSRRTASVITHSFHMFHILFLLFFFPIVCVCMCVFFIGFLSQNTVQSFVCVPFIFHQTSTSEFPLKLQHVTVKNDALVSSLMALHLYVCVCARERERQCVKMN